MENIRELTKAELEVMQVVWGAESLFLADIVERLEEPRPAYTTVSTVVRTLVKKGFVGYNTYGKTNHYFALVSKEEYTFATMNRVKMNFFDGSISNMISFFAKNEKLSKQEVAELQQMLEDND